MYGWLGNYDLGIENNGELMTTERPSSINYVSLKSLQSNIEQVMRADDNLTFNASLVFPVEHPVMCGTMESTTTTMSTEHVPDNNKTADLVLQILLGVLSSIILVLVILLICACQRLQRAKVNSPK